MAIYIWFYLNTHAEHATTVDNVYDVMEVAIVSYEKKKLASIDDAPMTVLHVLCKKLQRAKKSVQKIKTNLNTRLMARKNDG